MDSFCHVEAVYSRGMKTLRHQKIKPPKRFAVGTPVRVRLPGIDGVVIQVDEERTFMSQYMHTVQTKFGERSGRVAHISFCFQNNIGCAISGELLALRQAGRVRAVLLPQQVPAWTFA